MSGLLRAVRAGLVASLVLGSAAVIAASPVAATGSTAISLFSDPMTGATTSAPLVRTPTWNGAPNPSCLTAQSSATATPIPGCARTATVNGVSDADSHYLDPAGMGALRLTSSANNLEGGVFYGSSIPTSQGLDVTFDASQYLTSTYPADGISFLMAATDPTAPAPPTALGPPGGNLGYTAGVDYGNGPGPAPGLTHGYLGVGIDVYGNYSPQNRTTTRNANNTSSMSCPSVSSNANSAYAQGASGSWPQQVTVRGPGTGIFGYCVLSSTAQTAPPWAGGPTRLDTPAVTGTRDPKVPTEVVLNPSAASFTTPSGIVVAAKSYAVRVTYLDGTLRNLTGPLPSMTSWQAPTQWLDANGIPKQLSFGFVASTGAAREIHEIRNVTATSLFGAPPKFALSAVDNVSGTATSGSTLNYTLTPSLDPAGSNESQGVSLTWSPSAHQTITGALGSGWTCTTTGCTYPTGVQSGQSYPPVSVTSTVDSGYGGSISLDATISSGDGSPATTSHSVAIALKPTATTLAWAPPSAIGYGTALSNTQLNAAVSGNVPGTITYSPAAGTVLDAGTQTLTATFTPTDTVHYAPSSATVPLTVTPATPTITWSPADLTYPQVVGDGQRDAVANTPGTFTYDTDAGTTLAIGSHTMNVTFTPDSGDYTTTTAQTTFSVNPGDPGLSWATPASITYGTALSGDQLNATAAVPGTFAYDPPLGTRPTAGTHTLSVIFTPSDVNYATSVATVTLNVGIATPSITWPTPAAITYGTALDATQLDATSPVDGTFSYALADGSDPHGVTPGAGSHQPITVTFTPTDTVDYGPATATVYLDVAQATPTLTWPTPDPITYGTPLSWTQLNAVPSVGGIVNYMPAAGASLGAGSQTLSATFTPFDQTDYTAVTVTTTLQVNQAVPVITWNPADLTYGAPLGSAQQGATSSSAGTFSYSPDTGVQLDAGTHDLTASFISTDPNYTSVPAVTRTITVRQAVPATSWDAPAPITYGTPLSSAQQNATSDVDGTFVYDPPAGTVLGAGSQTLRATFVPIDSHNYTSPSVQVPLTVLRATPAITWATPPAIVYGTPLTSDQLGANAGLPGSYAYTLDGTSVSSGVTPHAGTHTLGVTFTPADDADYIATTGSVSLTVTKAPQTITFADPGAHTYGDAPFGLTAQGGGSNNPVTFATGSGSSGCTVAGSTVTITGSGTCVLVASQAGNDDYTAAADVTRSATVSKQTPTVTWSDPTPITYGTALGSAQLNAVVNPAEAAGDGTLVYTADGAAVAGAPVLHAGTHTLAVTYTPDSTNTSRYTGASRSVTLVVRQAGQTITFATPADVTYGQSTPALTATADSRLPVAFASSTTSVCTVSGTAVLIRAAGTCTVTATQPGNSDYAAATPVTRSFTVAKAPQQITLAPVADHTLGDPAFTEPVTGGGSSSSVVLSSATTSVCTVSGYRVTLVGVGTCTLSATQAGDGNFLAALPVSTSFGVGYRVTLGFDPTKAAQPGSVIPMKLTLVNGAGTAVSSSSITLHAVVVDTATAVRSPGNSQPGNNFSLNGSGYQFNLDTSGLASGQHLLVFTISGDPTRHTVPFTVR